jgi:hypothetical protein
VLSQGNAERKKLYSRTGINPLGYGCCIASRAKGIVEKRDREKKNE